MFRAQIIAVTLLLAGVSFAADGKLLSEDPSAAGGVKSAADRTALPALNSSPLYDPEAERQFLALANEARAQAGLPPLQLDEGLSRAARAHAAAMVAQHQLSHQLPGEHSLSQRLAATSDLHLDYTGENVAYAGSVTQAEDGLMHSPPHRENLLNANYNLAGMGVVWDGFILYVTQDFGHSLTTYSDSQAGNVVSDAIARTRRDASLTPLVQVDDRTAQTVACSMAQADSINTPGPRDHAVMRYTTMQPELVPDGAVKMIDDRRARAYSVGSCYARTATYPGGAYWIALILY
jgi:uncharacterized protein YkwD